MSFIHFPYVADMGNAHTQAEKVKSLMVIDVGK